jgi:hypothetical protein
VQLAAAARVGVGLPDAPARRARRDDDRPPAATHRSTPGTTSGGTFPRPIAATTTPTAPASRDASSRRASAPAQVVTMSTGPAGAAGAITAGALSRRRR